jgi:preprotein translocase SecE subunit
MALAVKDTPEAASRSLNRLAIGSLAGTAYVLACISAIFYLIPWLWNLALSSRIPSEGANLALLGLTVLAALVGGIALGRRLLGSSPPRGIRAGIFVGLVGFILIGFLTRAIGEMLQGAFGDNVSWLIVTLLVGLVLLAVGASFFFRPTFDRALVGIEEQGWFSATAYKKNQGQRVRRGTMLGILVLAGCGIYTMLVHDTLRTASTNWQVALPFTADKSLKLLPDVQFSVPILIAALSVWFAYRVVNFPVFADFLIATEAELNKVSWTTRKRLVQDTVVVLTTVLLFTLFLFVVDVAWSWILSRPFVGVIQTPDTSGPVQSKVAEW